MSEDEIRRENAWAAAEQAKEDVLRARIAELEAQLQRATDLVRFARGYLHDEEIISDEEYSQLLMKAGSVARLETQDLLRAENARLREALEVDPQKVADEILTWVTKQQYGGEPVLSAVICCDYVSNRRFSNGIARIIEAAIARRAV